MSGLAAVRLLDLLLNNWPSPVLVVYIVAELVLANWGIFCLKGTSNNEQIAGSLRA